MESINELLNQENINEIFLAKSFRYNLYILSSFIWFCWTLFPNNSTLTYICFACGSATFALLNDFVLKIIIFYLNLLFYT